MVTGQFSDSFPPIMDGVALAVSNYVAELNRTLGPAYAVVPACRQQGPEQGEAVCRYFSVPLASRPPYRLGLPRLDPSLGAVLQRLPFELVHAHSPFSSGRLALRLAREREIPIVATFHSRYRENFQQSLPFAPAVDWGVRRVVEFFESVDEVWAPTMSAARTLREYGFRGGVEVIRNGVDLAPPSDRESVRRQGGRLLGVDPGDLVFLYVGQHIWEKNLKLLMDALSAARRMGDRFRMIFVGEGYAAAALRARAGALGLSDCTRFAGVLRSRTALGACYARADCLLFPSLYETSGLVVSEAAAFGVPSLLVQGSAATEEVRDGVNAFVAADSAEAYAARLHELMACPERLVAVGAAARQSLYRSWTDVVAEVRRRYLRLIRRTELCGEPKPA